MASRTKKVLTLTQARNLYAKHKIATSKLVQLDKEIQYVIDKFEDSGNFVSVNAKLAQESIIEAIHKSEEAKAIIGNVVNTIESLYE